MTPSDFIRKWSDSELRERQGSQEHFIDLCYLLGVPTVLKTRTLTNLYNERPAWLDMAHRALDVAVAAAYGWPADLTDDQVLERLFALNQERAAAGR